jgi:asparagine synthase (glutamine-hydrolysing)
MCGIAGFVDFTGHSTDADLERMVRTLAHRGPDDVGLEVDHVDRTLVGLGQTRLAIIDLSSAGRQPMTYRHLTIVFNGEIYNYAEIRAELIALGHHFTSHGDTEALLHAYDEWGTACLSRLIGMFAFVLLDRRNSQIVMCRDRAGVKPFFLFERNGILLFASELKAFHRHPQFVGEIDPMSVREYMDFGYIPAPHSIFKHCRKLDAGSILTINLRTREQREERYWDVRQCYRLPPLDLSYDEAKAELRALLASACNYRMVADVPIGVFLSGGYDSTAVVAFLAAARPAESIRTFTIGFHGGNNEAPRAKRIASLLGTSHTELYCDIREAREIFPTLPRIFDEPFADSSAIPTILVSQLARKEVTVALSADGGDETFAGYSVYRHFLQRLALLNRIPNALRGLVRGLCAIGARGAPFLDDRVMHRMDVVSRVLASTGPLNGQYLFAEYFKPTNLVARTMFREDVGRRPTPFDADYSKFTDDLSTALAIDYRMYLKDDILTKVDRATMSVSLEGREPLLDHRLIEFAARLPSSYKVGGLSKRILRDVVHEFVPRELLDHPKTGFSAPVDQWLRTGLRDLLEHHLSEEAVARAGMFAPQFVRRVKEAFFRGSTDHFSYTWKLLQYHMWFDEWMQ